MSARLAERRDSGGREARSTLEAVRNVRLWMRRAVLLLIGAAAGLLIPRHIHHEGVIVNLSSSGVHWTDVVTAVATAAGVSGGALVAIFYGRKASASISAEVHVTETGVVLAARPAVVGAGIFRIRFARQNGAKVRVTEVFRVGDNLVDGIHWVADAVFGESFVEGGETLTTTVVFPLPGLFLELVGWRVSFGVTCSRMLGKGWSWGDQVFVPRLPVVHR